MFQLVIYVMTMVMVPHQVAGQYVFAPKTHMVQAPVKREDFSSKVACKDFLARRGQDKADQIGEGMKLVLGGSLLRTRVGLACTKIEPKTPAKFKVIPRVDDLDI